MKPTFRKVYLAPGYWSARHPAPRAPWNLDPANVKRYGSLFSWPKPSLNMDELFKAFYAICRERELNPITSDVYVIPGRPGIYDFLMRPERPRPRDELDAIVDQARALHQDPRRGCHHDDILRLPLGAAVREDCTADRFYPEDAPPDL